MAISISIPGYRIVRAIGRGGMATVYLAIQENFQRQVALKIMSAELAREQDFSERFLREARIVSQLVHPNIVTVHDVGIQNDHHYLSMEYIDGKDLKAQLPEMDGEQIFRLMKEVAMALDYAGSKGYVHRDVKPENIMLHSHDGRAVLMDFGIARASRPDNSMTKTGTALGTPHYMSPEQARGAEVDGRSDLYSLGVLFYYMLVGKVPFEADSPVAVGVKHLTEPVPTLPAPLACYQPVLNKLMAKKPEQRFQRGRDVCLALTEVPARPLQQWHEREGFSFQSTRLDTPVRDTVTVEFTDEPTPKPSAPDTKPITQAAVAKATVATKAVETKVTTEHKATTEPKATMHTPAATEAGPHSEPLRIPTEDLAGRTRAGEKKRRSPVPILLVLIIAAAGVAYLLFPVQVRQGLDDTLVLIERWRDKPATVHQEKLADGTSDNTQSTAPLATAPTVEPRSETPITETTAAAADAPSPSALQAPDDSGSDDATGVAETESLALLQQQIAAIASEVDGQPQRRSELIGLYRQVLAIDPENTEALAGINAEKSNMLAEVRKQIDNNELVVAQSLLATLLSAFPELEGETSYTQLQQDLQERMAIQTLLAQAQQYLSENKLQKPAGENALESYRAVLALEANNTEAKNGLAAIAKRYQQMAVSQQKNQQYGKALELVTSGLAAAPDSGDLKQLQAQLQSQLQAQQSIQRLLEEAQTFVRQDKIFTRPDGAVQRYLKVLAIDANHPVATQSLQALIEERYRLIVQSLEQPNYEKASAQVEEALALLPRDERLLALLLETESSKPAVENLTLSGTTLDSLQQLQSPTISADRTLYIGFRYKNLIEPTTVFQVTLFDGSRSRQIAAVPVVVTGSEGDSRFRIDRAVEGFTEGGYHIDIVLNGQPIYTQAFTIAK